MEILILNAWHFYFCSKYIILHWFRAKTDHCKELGSKRVYICYQNCKKCKGYEDLTNGPCECQQQWKTAKLSCAKNAQKRRADFNRNMIPIVFRALKSTVTTRRPQGNHKQAIEELNAVVATQNFAARIIKGKLILLKKKWTQKSFSNFLRSAAAMSTKLLQFQKKRKQTKKKKKKKQSKKPTKS